MSMPTLTGAWSDRRRAWLLAGCAGLLVLIYLLGWTAYAANGLVILGRQRQLDPGQIATVRGADFRVLGLRQTKVARDDDSDRFEAPVEGASWVVVDVEVTRRQDVPDFYCGFVLAGPDRRRYEPDAPAVTRLLPSTCRAEELPLGQPRRVEVFFVVPDRFLDRIYGLAVVDSSSREPTQVLRPPD